MQLFLLKAELYKNSYLQQMNLVDCVIVGFLGVLRVVQMMYSHNSMHMMMEDLCFYTNPLYYCSTYRRNNSLCCPKE